MSRLQALRDDLRWASTIKEVAEAVVRHGMAALGAMAGALGFVCDGGSALTLIGKSGPSIRALAPARVCPIDTHAPLAFVARSGHAVWLSGADYATHYPRLSRSSPAVPIACVPVRLGGLPWGALGFVLPDGRELSSSERAFLIAIASQCAGALDRVRLREVKSRGGRRSESAATRLERVQRVTAALSRAPGIGEVAEIVAREGKGGLGAELCMVAEWDRGAARLLAQAGEDEAALERARRMLLSEWLPEVARIGATQDPITLREIPDAPAGAVLACVPMLVEGRLLGALTFWLKRQRATREETQAFMVALGDLCGQALERARLYEAERAARTRAEAAAQAAEDAGRLKDTFLGIVSHELRTPLTAILGWANILRSREDVPAETLARALGSIARNAAQQARIVDELLDASQITRGGIELTCEPLDVRSSLESALADHAQAAAMKRIDLRTSLPARGADEELVSGDRMRLHAAFSHLVSNAIKFTPAGGRVEVALHHLGDAVRIEIRDTGEGIDAELLPRLFEQFHQADTSISRRHGGLGLGLSIVRYIIEAHGGRVSAHSRGRGQGATLVVDLPLLKAGITRPGDPDTEIRVKRDAQLEPTVEHKQSSGRALAG